jgi:hypothetical protein
MVPATAYTFATMLVYQLKLKTRTDVNTGTTGQMRTVDSV